MSNYGFPKYYLDYEQQKINGAWFSLPSEEKRPLQNVTFFVRQAPGYASEGKTTPLVAELTGEYYVFRG